MARSDGGQRACKNIMLFINGRHFCLFSILDVRNNAGSQSISRLVFKMAYSGIPTVL